MQEVIKAGQYPAIPTTKGSKQHAREAEYSRDMFNLTRLLGGESFGATPTEDNKWVKSANRLRSLGWSITEFDTSSGSTFFKLDQTQLATA
jgi:hypothetical protein